MITTQDSKENATKSPYDSRTHSRQLECKFLIKFHNKLNLVNKSDKHESKVTAIAGSGIMSDMMKTTDEFMISNKEKEEKKVAPTRMGSNLNEGKRTNSGFKTSAASMFTSQTGGKNSYQD